MLAIIIVYNKTVLECVCVYSSLTTSKWAWFLVLPHAGDLTPYWKLWSPRKKTTSCLGVNVILIWNVRDINVYFVVLIKCDTSEIDGAQSCMTSFVGFVVCVCVWLRRRVGVCLQGKLQNTNQAIRILSILIWVDNNAKVQLNRC